MPSEPKFQHYVPRFQLRYLTDKSGQVFIYDRIKNEYRKQSLNSIGGENKIYTWIDKDGNENTDVEKAFTAVESEAAPIIEKLHNQKIKTLTGQERAELSMLLALNWLRTPAQIGKIKLLMEAGINMHFRANALNKDAFYKQVEEFEREKGITYGDKEALRQSILNNRNRVGFPKVAYLRSILELLLEITEEIKNMSWLIHVIQDKKSYIIPDINFTVENPEAETRGLMVPGTQSMCVLTNKVTIVLKPGPYSEVYRNPDFLWVRANNMISAGRSQRYIFSNSEALLKSIVNRTKINEIKPDKMGFSVFFGPENKTFTFTKESIEES